jgi:hypothetical protein
MTPPLSLFAQNLDDIELRGGPKSVVIWQSPEIKKLRLQRAAKSSKDWA